MCSPFFTLIQNFLYFQAFWMLEHVTYFETMALTLWLDTVQSISATPVGTNTAKVIDLLEGTFDVDLPTRDNDDNDKEEEVEPLTGEEEEHLPKVGTTTHVAAQSADIVNLANLLTVPLPLIPSNLPPGSRVKVGDAKMRGEKPIGNLRQNLWIRLKFISQKREFVILTLVYVRSTSVSKLSWEIGGIWVSLQACPGVQISSRELWHSGHPHPACPHGYLHWMLLLHKKIMVRTYMGSSFEDPSPWDHQRWPLLTTCRPYCSQIRRNWCCWDPVRSFLSTTHLSLFSIGDQWPKMVLLYGEQYYMSWRHSFIYQSCLSAPFMSDHPLHEYFNGWGCS